MDASRIPSRSRSGMNQKALHLNSIHEKNLQLLLLGSCDRDVAELGIFPNLFLLMLDALNACYAPCSSRRSVLLHPYVPLPLPLPIPKYTHPHPSNSALFCAKNSLKNFSGLSGSVVAKCFIASSKCGVTY